MGRQHGPDLVGNGEEDAPPNLRRSAGWVNELVQVRVEQLLKLKDSGLRSVLGHSAMMSVADGGLSAGASLACTARPRVQRDSLVRRALLFDRVR